MIVFERLGGWGLGNSLFQIATTYAMAKENNTSYAFPEDCNFRKQRFKENNTLFKNQLPWVNIDDIRQQTHNNWGYGGPGYIPYPVYIKNHLIIDGFFQSEKYFEKYREEIIQLFKLKEESTEYIKNKYINLVDKESCTIHIRRGDYLTAREMKVLDIQYYNKAVDYLGKNRQYIIFSDDIKWCKDNLTHIPNKVFIEEGNDLLEMYLMSLFSYHIIGNSTFSWWGAWLSESKITVAPNPKTNWFSQDFYKEHLYVSNYQDLIPKNWIIL